MELFFYYGFRNGGGLASYEEIANTGYALLSAGLKPSEALKGTQTALEVAKITRGNGEEVANIMATASKDFHTSMDRVGDILAKTQVKFQIKNFSQLEEGFKYVAASASALNLPLSQTATIIGKLNDAGLQGSMAGTGFSGILNEMQKASVMLGLKIPRNKSGELDIISWTKEVSKRVKSMTGGDKNLEFASYSKIFGGAESARAFLVLSNRSKELAADFKDVEENSKGITKKEIIKYQKSFAFQLDALHNSMEVLAGAIAKVMIPMFNKWLNTIKPYVLEAITWVKTHEDLTKKIFLTAAAFAALAVAAGGLAIVKMLLEPFVALSKTLVWVARVFQLGKIAMLAFRTAAVITRVAMWALNVAFMANPIGAVIALVVGLGIVAYKLVKNWGKVKEFFVNLWDNIKTGALGAINWLKKLIEPIFKLWDRIKGFLGGKKEVKVSSNNNSTSTNVAGVASKEPASTSSNNEHQLGNIVYNNTFNISGSNLDANSVADLVLNKLKELHQTSMVG